jgi:hypothetical protein
VLPDPPTEGWPKTDAPKIEGPSRLLVCPKREDPNVGALAPKADPEPVLKAVGPPPPENRPVGEGFFSSAFAGLGAPKLKLGGAMANSAAPPDGAAPEDPDLDFDFGFCGILDF